MLLQRPPNPLSCFSCHYVPSHSFLCSMFRVPHEKACIKKKTAVCAFQFSAMHERRRTVAEKQNDWRERPTVPLWPTAGQILGIGRGTAYEAAKTGQIKVLEFGRRKVVPTAWLRKQIEAA